MRRNDAPAVRLIDSTIGNGVELAVRGRRNGWEGLIVKRPDGRYAGGSRGPGWQKLKFTNSEEFVVGGWTAPRGSRRHFGAPAPRLPPGRGPLAVRAARVFAGQVGTGFTDAELDRLAGLLAPLARDAAPFVELAPPKPSEKRHWVEPVLVVQTSFSQWTPDGVLRHPVYEGLRSDKRAADVRQPARRPPAGRAHGTASTRHAPGAGRTRRARHHGRIIDVEVPDLPGGASGARRGRRDWDPSDARRPGRAPEAPRPPTAGRSPRAPGTGGRRSARADRGAGTQPAGAARSSCATARASPPATCTRCSGPSRASPRASCCASTCGWPRTCCPSSRTGRSS